MKAATKSYLDKAVLLSVEEQERLLSRMTGKLPKRLEKDKLSREEALAIQLELEDEQLQEWRTAMAALKAKTAKTQEKASKKVAKAKVATDKASKPKASNAKTKSAATAKKPTTPSAKPKSTSTRRTAATAKKVVNVSPSPETK
jgi:peptidoglycan hydrolase CwlO-like protein